MTEYQSPHRQVEPCWEPECERLRIPSSRGCAKHCTDLTITAEKAALRQREVNLWAANCECVECQERPYPLACIECGGEVAEERPGYVHAWDCSSRSDNELYRIDQSKPPLVFAFPTVVFPPTRMRRGN